MGGAIILVWEVIARSMFLVSPRSARVSTVKEAEFITFTIPNSPCSTGPAGGVGAVAGVGVGDGVGVGVGCGVISILKLHGGED